MSNHATETYIEQAVENTAEVVEKTIFDYYHHGFNTAEGDLEDCIGYESFRDGVIREIIPVKYTHGQETVMKELERNIKGENK